MTGSLINILIVFALLTATSLWWVGRERRHAANHVAEALIGEIAAVLEAIETQDLVEMLDKVTKEDRTANEALRVFSLPHFTAFNANVAKLDRLPGPIERIVVHLFDRWSVLPAEVVGATVSTDEARRVLNELNQSLRQAEEVLLALRRIASPRSQAHHLTG